MKALILTALLRHFQLMCVQWIRESNFNITSLAGFLPFFQGIKGICTLDEDRT